MPLRPEYIFPTADLFKDFDRDGYKPEPPRNKLEENIDGLLESYLIQQEHNPNIKLKENFGGEDCVKINLSEISDAFKKHLNDIKERYRAQGWYDVELYGDSYWFFGTHTTWWGKFYFREPKCKNT